MQFVGVGVQVPAAAHNNTPADACEERQQQHTRVPAENAHARLTLISTRVASTCSRLMLGAVDCLYSHFAPCGSAQPPVLVQRVVGSLGVGAKYGLLHTAVHTRTVVPLFTKSQLSQPSVPAGKKQRTHRQLVRQGLTTTLGCLMAAL
jgi:hypothetical protein